MTTKFKGAWVTHVGKKKPHNEDSIFFGKRSVCGPSMNDPEIVGSESVDLLVGVADGVGGHNAGEIASRVCVEAMKGLEEVSKPSVDFLLRKLNKEIFEKSEKDVQFKGMGTTVAGLVFGSGNLFAFNVGDSRVYRFHCKRGLERVTLDDSLLERGEGKAGTAMPFAPSNVITQALGGRKNFKEIVPNFYDLDEAEEALYLVCSDGLNDMVEDQAIEKILRDHDPWTNPIEAVRALLGAALDGGGRDNVSIVIAPYTPNNLQEKPEGGSWLSRLWGRGA